MNYQGRRKCELLKENVHEEIGEQVVFGSMFCAGNVTTILLNQEVCEYF